MYQVISNFQGGLDARKYLLSLPPGTLTTLINAHISQGAEIEKRKAFVPAALPAGTFGAQETPAGLLVFGSAAAPVITQPAGTTIAYQRLQHPGGSAMTAVIWSTLFSAKAWVIASFADGSVYEFYDGVIIGDFRNGGRQIDFTSNATIAASLVALVNADGTYTAAQIGATAQFTVTAAAGVNFNVSQTLDTAAGTLVSQLNNTAIDGVAGAAAQGSFQIMAGKTAFATGVFDTNGQPANGNTRTVNGITYTFVTVIGATPGNVLIDSTATLTMTNFENAVNGGAGAGVKYINTAVHPNASVTCGDPVAGAVTHIAVTLTAKISGTGGNYAMSKVGANLTVPATLTGGDASQVTQVTIGGTNLLLAAVDFVTDTGTTAAAVATAVNANGGTGYTATSTGGIVTIFSAVGVAANGFQVSVTVKGRVAIGNCQFVLSGTGFSLSALAVDGTSILPAALTFPQNTGQGLNTFMKAVVSAINTIAASTGFTSAFQDGKIFISKVTTTSSDGPLSVTGTVTPVGTGTGAITAPADTVVLVSVTPTNITLFLLSGTSDAAVVTATGGVAPYSYAWSFTDDTGGHFRADSPAGASTTFSLRSGNQSLSGVVHAVCKVTDYVGNVGTTGPVTINYKLF